MERKACQQSAIRRRRRGCRWTARNLMTNAIRHHKFILRRSFRDWALEICDSRKCFLGKHGCAHSVPTCIVHHQLVGKHYACQFISSESSRSPLSFRIYIRRVDA